MKKSDEQLLSEAYESVRKKTLLAEQAGEHQSEDEEDGEDEDALDQE